MIRRIRRLSNQSSMARPMTNRSRRFLSAAISPPQNFLGGACDAGPLQHVCPLGRVAAIGRGISKRVELIIGDKDECCRVQTKPQAFRSRSVVKDMPEVPLAPRTQHFGAEHADADILALFNIVCCDGMEKARPAGARVELRAGRKEGQVAAGAGVNAFFLMVVKRAAEGLFGPFVAQHLELFRCQPLAPLSFASHHGRRLDGPDQFAPAVEDVNRDRFPGSRSEVPRAVQRSARHRTIAITMAAAATLPIDSRKRRSMSQVIQAQVIDSRIATWAESVKRRGRLVQWRCGPLAAALMAEGAGTCKVFDETARSARP